MRQKFQNLFNVQSMSVSSQNTLPVKYPKGNNNTACGNLMNATGRKFNVLDEALILLINLALNGFETLAHIINIQYQRSGLTPDLIRLQRDT